MRRPHSLGTRVALCTGALVAVVVALSGLVIALRIDHQERAQVDRQLTLRAAKIQTDAAKQPDRAALLGEEDKPGRSGSDANLLAGSESATRVLAGDRVVATRGPAVPPGVPARLGLATVTIGGVPWRSLVQPTTAVAGGRLQVLQSLAPVQQRLHANARLIAVVTAFATLVTALGAWLVSRIVLRPLQRLRAVALEIGPGRRLPELRGPQEIMELSATLNGMLERLERSSQAMRRFTADAGHELRTPLTGLGMDLETLRRNPGLADEQRAEILDAMTAEHTRVVALLFGLQQLARGDAEALPGRTEVDLAELAQEALESARRRHPDVSYRLDARPAAVDGWPDGLRLALDNLLDNAALHGRPAGDVSVTVRPGRITVSDDGQGIAPADRGRLVERFARGTDPRSPGSGLGLALVSQQARLHAGRLVLGATPAGGLNATLELGTKRTPGHRLRARLD